MMATTGATSVDAHSAANRSDMTRHGRDEVLCRDSAAITDRKIEGGL